MRAVAGTTPGPDRGTRGPEGHEWVGAALVGLGRRGTRRAEHAARTGWHFLPARTKIEVLEVYCARCRTFYDPGTESAACSAVARRAG